MNRPIYMDYQATTPVDERVLEVMLPFFRESFGNAASNSHSYGWEAAAAVKQAREQCARILGAEPIDILFTSGSTEGINLALKGTAELHAGGGGREIITCVTEHPAVLDTVRYLEGRGVKIVRLEVDSAGMIDLARLERAITKQTILVALMAANNEIGSVHPSGEIGRICREHGVLFFCDATQGVGKLPLDVKRDHIDMLSFTGHKMYGPKGVGALYVRKAHPNVRLACQFHGGGQERGMRPGTLNVAGIVGLGKACELAQAELKDEIQRLTALRERLRRGIMDSLDHARLNGHATERLPGNLNLGFAYVDGEALMMDMKEVAVSSGSACNSTSRQASHVLKAIQTPEEQTHASIRFGLGRMTTEAEVDRVIALTVRGVRRLREMSPLYELARREESSSD
ncbi:MAG: aminotransferase class V-fold PLP-dependent enzyme [Planctomycetota bacterium]